MVIQHNIPAISAGRNLNVNQSALNKNLEKLSSGYKINRAGDDAAGLAISEQMRSQINGLNQAVNNANDSIGMIQTAEGALTEVHSMLQRMVTLTTEASNATMNSISLPNIQTEMEALTKEIDRIAQYTDFNKKKPLMSGNDFVFQIGPTKDETVCLVACSMTAKDLGISGVYSDATKVASDTTTSKPIGPDLKNNEQLDKINAAINTVSTYRAQLGSIQNRLEHTVNSLKVTSENVQAAESRIRDTDMADEVTSFTKNNILLQAAQSMLSQANAAPQGTLSLLQ